MSSLRFHLRPPHHACPIVAGALILLASATSAEAGRTSCPGGADVPAPGAVERTAEAVGCVINEERARRGRRRLRLQANLQRAAGLHSRDMVRRSYFSHTSLEGRTFVTRVRGYTHGFVWKIGETLAWGSGGSGSPEAIVQAWLQSATHRRVMLDTDYREVGIGVAAGLPLSNDAGATFTADYGVRR